MKLQNILCIIALSISGLVFSDEHYGYIENVKNNYPNGFLFIKNTDPNPGTFYNNVDGNNILIVLPNKEVNSFNNYVIPWDDFGGKIYAWVTDNSTGEIISAAKMYDKENVINIENDSALKAKNRVAAQTWGKGMCKATTVKSGESNTSNTRVTITVDVNGVITSTLSCNE